MSSDRWCIRMRYTREQTRMAYHEAGHALAAMHFTHFSSIGIERQVKRYGRIFTQRQGWLHPVRGETVSLENYILFHLAGPMAEELCPYGPGPHFYHTSANDRESVCVTLSEIGFVEGEEDTNDYMAECRARVKNMLKTHWPEIVALAKALLERKRLTGAQAEKIAAKVWEKEKDNHTATNCGKKKEGKHGKHPGPRGDMRR